MTVQAQEILQYRDNNYSLIGSPLYPYLQKNKKVVFEDYSTAHIKGFQGRWLLKKGQLFLISLESSNYTIFDLFKTHKPILADWFSDTLEFGLGKKISDHWWGYFENYLWLRFEKGIVVEKKILKKFNNEPKIRFGKYNSSSIREILFGKINERKTLVIKDFIQAILDYIIVKNNNLAIQIPRVEFDEIDYDLINEIKQFGVQNFLTQTYIAVSSNYFLENSKEDKKAERLSLLLERILSSKFKNKIILPSKCKTKEFDKRTILINSDFNYLIWAIRNVENFSVPPDYLNPTSEFYYNMNGFEIKKLKTFKIKRLNRFVFEYEPIYEESTFNFSQKVLDLNLKKFEKNHKVKFDNNRASFFVNLTNSELIKKFGYYLDENYISKEIDDNEYDYFNNFEYDYDNWLVDAAGTDDAETMNDVYWNLD